MNSTRTQPESRHGSRTSQKPQPTQTIHRWDSQRFVEFSQGPWAQATTTVEHTTYHRPNKHLTECSCRLRTHSKTMVEQDHQSLGQPTFWQSAAIDYGPRQQPRQSIPHHWSSQHPMECSRRLWAQLKSMAEQTHQPLGQPTVWQSAAMDIGATTIAQHTTDRWSTNNPMEYSQGQGASQHTRQSISQTTGQANT